MLVPARFRFDSEFLAEPSPGDIASMASRPSIA